MLNRLPAELVLSVLGYCGVQTTTRIRLASREWQQFIMQNENAAYRAAAIYHGFADLSQSIEDVSAEWPEIISEDVRLFRGWKEYCQRRYQLEKSWDGRGTGPKTRLYRSTGKDVHRFKLDEREDARFVITTHRGGGLRVTCMDSDVALFELDKVYVRDFAHCEYGNGFLVFDRFHPHALEIWRLSNEWDGSTIPDSNVLYRPDDNQLNAPRRVSDPTGRGSFSPWALFTPRENPRAYRFVYPHLLVGSEWGQELYVFDVPSTTLAEIIAIPEAAAPPDGQGVQINYVELGARHAFVCTPYSVLVIPRFQSRRRRVEDGEVVDGLYDGDGDEDGGEEAVRYLQFPGADPALKNPQLVRHYAMRMVQTQTFGLPSNEAMTELVLVSPQVPVLSTALVAFGEGRQEFTAVHISGDGRHFVAVTVYGIAYFVRDFERAVRGETSLANITLRINLGTSALNLAFEHDRVVISTLHGVFIFNLHTGAPYDVIPPPKHHRSQQSAPEEAPLGVLPRLSAYQLLAFRNPLPLRLVSCVKVTRTGVWFDWSARALEEVEGRVAPLLAEEEREGEGDHPYATRMVCRIDFSLGEVEREVNVGTRSRYRQYQESSVTT